MALPFSREITSMMSFHHDIVLWHGMMPCSDLRSQDLALFNDHEHHDVLCQRAVYIPAENIPHIKSYLIDGNSSMRSEWRSGSVVGP